MGCRKHGAGSWDESCCARPAHPPGPRRRRDARVAMPLIEAAGAMLPVATSTQPGMKRYKAARLPLRQAAPCPPHLSARAQRHSVQAGSPSLWHTSPGADGPGTCGCINLPKRACRPLYRPRPSRVMTAAHDGQDSGFRGGGTVAAAPTERTVCCTHGQQRPVASTPDSVHGTPCLLCPIVRTCCRLESRPADPAPRRRHGRLAGAASEAAVRSSAPHGPRRNGHGHTAGIVAACVERRSQRHDPRRPGSSRRRLLAYLPARPRAWEGTPGRPPQAAPRPPAQHKAAAPGLRQHACAQPPPSSLRTSGCARGLSRLATLSYSCRASAAAAPSFCRPPPPVELRRSELTRVTP